MTKIIMKKIAQNYSKIIIHYCEPVDNSATRPAAIPVDIVKFTAGENDRRT